MAGIYFQKRSNCTSIAFMPFFKRVIFVYKIGGNLKRFTILLTLCLLCGPRPTFSQNIKVLIYDPTGDYSALVDSSFQQIFSNSIQITSTLPSQLADYNALFLMLQGKSGIHSLTKAEGDSLVNYLKLGGNIFISTFFDPGVDSVAFWNFIGVKSFVSSEIADQVDSLVGTDSTFTKGLVIHIKFQSGGMPFVIGNMIPIIEAKGNPGDFPVDYMAKSDSYNVILNIISPLYVFNSVYLSQVAESFHLVPVSGVKSENGNYPKSLALLHNYPNPFNPSTKIQYSIPAEKTGNASLVQLKVYNILGSEVATLVNRKEAPGNYEVQFNADNLPSGIYFYRLTYGNLSKVQKMILLK
jgi:Secretion system C-terminal sorting domain